MTTQELVEQQAQAFKAKLHSRGLPKRLNEPGFSGSLGDVFLPNELVDQMESAIEDAFEHVEAEESHAEQGIVHEQ